MQICIVNELGAGVWGVADLRERTSSRDTLYKSAVMQKTAVGGVITLGWFLQFSVHFVFVGIATQCHSVVP